jgi:DNA repair exonuclease SbcCD nuclease subunit
MSNIIINNSKAAVISDVHIGTHANNLVWHKITLDWAKWFKAELISKDIKDIIFCGDFYHYRDSIDVNTLQIGADILNLWQDFNIVMIVGNHCSYFKDNSSVNSLSVFSGWKNITVVSKLTTVELFGKKVVFAPWGTKLEDIPQSDLVFGHFEIQSFKYNQFSICNSGLNSEEILNKAPLIITGHFHLRESREYTNGKRILYCGNPFQMDFGDIGNIKGYYILDFNTLQYEFFENVISPIHHKVTLSEMVQEGKITDEIKKKFSNNFIKLIIDKSISSDETDFLIRKLSELKPVTLTPDYAFTFNKFKIDDDKNIDFSGVDIVVAIKEFINLLDTPFKQEITEYTTNLYERCK